MVNYSTYEQQHTINQRNSRPAMGGLAPVYYAANRRYRRGNALAGKRAVMVAANAGNATLRQRTRTEEILTFCP